MKQLSLSLMAAALLLSGCSNTPSVHNALTSSEKGDGWKLLFDGSSLTGWRAYMDDPVEGAWSVSDGALLLKHGSTKDTQANLITVAEYDDFELRFDWKIESGTNSGVIFHIGEGPKKPYLTGPEYQVLDDKGFRSAKGEPVTREEYTGSHYAIEASAGAAPRPIGEWNSSRILVKGNHVEYWLNGEKTAEYDMHSSKWNEQIANSKFAKWKEFATTGKGHIGLQDHGHAAWFRNLKIKEL